MRRAFVAKDRAAGQRGFAFGFALHQHGNLPGETVDLGLLTGDDVAQVIDVAGQVGDFFFELFHKHASIVAASPRQGACPDLHAGCRVLQAGRLR